MMPCWSLRSLCASTALSILLSTATPAAQAPEAPEAPESDAAIVTPFFRVVTRFDGWSFFEPTVPGREPDYVLLGNRATLGMLVDNRRLQLYGAFQYGLIFGLPRGASGPDPLGPGGMYYDAAGMPAAYQLYFKALSLRVKGIAPGLSLEAGRMGHETGSARFETGPGHAKRESTQRLIDQDLRDRLAGRLIGEVGWSAFERAFDGVRFDLNRGRLNATAALLWPTQGVFEESANPTLDKVRVATAEVAVSSRAVANLTTANTTDNRDRSHELQLFAHHYSDHRDVTTRPDNTGLSPQAADVDIATFGASHLGSYEIGSARADSVLWVAGQFGDWYGVPHQAVSVIAEGGYRWPIRWQPWIRGGVLHASGDRNPLDARHGTFFPMLPSTKPDLMAGTFAQMNLRDVFAELRLKPHPRVAISGGVHRMSLAAGNDGWYSGTGATARHGDFFGFVIRPGGGSTDLGLAAMGSTTIDLGRRWIVVASLATMKGGAVIRQLFAGNRLTVVSLEGVLTVE